MKQLSIHKQTSAKIRELYTAGKLKQEIKDELNVDRNTVNIALGYMLKKAKQATQAPAAEVSILYAARDAQMKKFYASLNTKGALSMTHALITENTHKGKTA